MTEHRAGGGERRGDAAAFVAGVRRRARRTLLASACLRVAGLALAAVLLLAVADFLFRLPRGIRLLHGLLLLAGAAEAFRRWILPAVRFRPSLADVALRLERSGHVPEGTRDRLASGVELGGSAGEGLTAALASAAAREADVAARGLRGLRLVRRTGLGRAAAMAGMALLAGAGLWAARPDLARIGVSRTIWPFGEADWPKRTQVVDATLVEVHPLGEALPLRAIVTRTPQAPGRTDVAARYRVLGDGRSGALERLMLTSQVRQAAVGDREGELYERLIEPGAAGEGEIEYWFETEDDRTATRRIRLAARPRVDAVRATVAPPEYAAALAGSFVRLEGEAVKTDAQRAAAVGPILAGSVVELHLALNKPSWRQGEDEAGWSQSDARTLRYRAVAQERGRVEVSLVDAEGLESPEPLVIVLEVVEDAPPAVAIVEPTYDESVLATAVVPVAAEGRDDLGMEWLTIEERLARVPGGSEGAPPAPLGEPREVARVAPDAAVGELVARADLDLAVLGARAGDEVWITAAGRDAFAAPSGAGEHERVVRSPVRRLRVIDELAFVEQIRGELAGVRKAAIQIDADQRTLGELADGSAGDAAEPESQRSITDRLDAQQRTMDRLLQRIERNSLGDQPLEGLVRDGRELLESATTASAEAARRLEAPEDAASDRLAAQAQERVRENLESVIAMLDQGQDSWIARRTVENLLGEQRALAAETAALGEQTMGKAIEQLDAEELSELERIAARQRDAAERARQALETLTERAEQLRGVDPGQAQAMARAAQRGRQERLAEQMRQAAAQVGENQTRAAAQGQQAALEALEDMLGDIDSAESVRDEALRRVLASVIESLESLIAAQEREIAALVGVAEDEAAALAEAMLGVAGNTLGLLDEIGQQRDLATVTRLVEQAAEAQQRAVVSLRQSSTESAAEAEDESLARLREALAEAERLEEDAAERESARERAELRRAYRDLLEEQVSLEAETGEYVAVELDRRARAHVRGLGQRQEAVAQRLAEIREATDALEDATVFEMAHARMDRASAAAAERLIAGEADEGVRRSQGTVVRVLRALVEALAEQPQDQQFRDQQGSNGGSGGSGGGSGEFVIPELAELKLLRAMQAEAMEWTRNADESPTPADDDDMEALSSLQRQLAERAQELLEKVTRQQEQPMPRLPGSTGDTEQEDSP